MTDFIHNFICLYYTKFILLITILFIILEKATSQLLLEPDWESILQICDCIRQGDVQ